ncbi:GNAT family protein [Spirillospora sp. NPDC048819]|uniref:GNAT family N-acetyltransferase n=1 Tax=Spirillospora sp. NPDC048819 TaxID=3155268 RepID=UPI0033F5DF0A
MGGVLAAGPQVMVRPLADADRAEFVERAAASAALHRPWLWLPLTAEQFGPYLARFDEVSAVAYAVCRRDGGEGGGEMVGHVTINHILRAGYQRGVLGYGAFVPHQGRGHMSEGLGLVLDDAFGRLGLHRLEAEIQPANEPSINLVKRLGFRKEGLAVGLVRIEDVWRDHERWAITAETHAAAEV